MNYRGNQAWIPAFPLHLVRDTNECISYLCCKAGENKGWKFMLIHSECFMVDEMNWSYLVYESRNIYGQLTIGTIYIHYDALLTMNFFCKS